MIKEELAEKRCSKYFQENCYKENRWADTHDLVVMYLDGFNKANEWHYVKDGLPKVSGRYWVYTGGEPFTLDFDTEVNAFGYWCAVLSDSLGVCDTVFETVEERKEDEVIAWKEIVLPEPSKYWNLSTGENNINKEKE